MMRLILLTRRSFRSRSSRISLKDGGSLRSQVHNRNPEIGSSQQPTLVLLIRKLLCVYVEPVVLDFRRWKLVALGVHFRGKDESGAGALLLGVPNPILYTTVVSGSDRSVFMMLMLPS